MSYDSVWGCVNLLWLWIWFRMIVWLLCWLCEITKYLTIRPEAQILDITQASKGFHSSPRMIQGDLYDFEKLGSELQGRWPFPLKYLEITWESPWPYCGWWRNPNHPLIDVDRWETSHYLVWVSSIPGGASSVAVAHGLGKTNLRFSPSGHSTGFLSIHLLRLLTHYWSGHELHEGNTNSQCCILQVCVR